MGPATTIRPAKFAVAAEYHGQPYTGKHSLPRVSPRHYTSTSITTSDPLEDGTPWR